MFTLANNEPESKTVYAIYSAKEVYQKTDYIGEFGSEPFRKVEISHNSSKSETRAGEIRSEPNGKVEISLHFNKNKVFSGGSGEITDIPISANSAELGRVMVNDLDLEEQIIRHKCKIQLGSGTKIDELRNPLKISIIFICLVF